MNRSRSRLLAVAVASCVAVSARAQAPAIASMEWSSPVVGELLADTDGDGVSELLVLHRDGLLRRLALRSGNAASLVDVGSMLLRDPLHSLVACRDDTMVDAPRHGPNIDARRQPHIERDPIPAARDVRRPGGGTAEGRGELLDAARSVISASIAQHTRK